MLQLMESKLIYYTPIHHELQIWFCDKTCGSSDEVKKPVMDDGGRGHILPALWYVHSRAAPSSCEQRCMWGDTLLWQLVWRVATVGCTLVELNLEINSQIDHEIEESTNQAYHSWVTVVLFVSVCVGVCMFPAAGEQISHWFCHESVGAKWFSRDTSQERELAL